MDALDYLETQASKTLDFARDDYDHLHERMYKFAMLLIAGGGAVAAYALGEFSKAPVKLFAWLPLASLALVWLAYAAWLMRSGLTTREVSAGPKVDTLIARWKFEVNAKGEEAAALTELRMAALEKLPGRIAPYVKASDERAAAIDKAYRCVPILSLVIPLVAVLICWKFG